MRNQLFWFDILGQRMLSRDSEGAIEWQFDEQVSAAGWISRDKLLVASETMLMALTIETGESRMIMPLEPDQPETRSNDGRADPWGGFWIGTMGKMGERNAGAIYRYYAGKLRKLHDGMTIPNAICFCPNQRYAYFTDTPSQMVMRQALDPMTGWPSGSPEPFIDLKPEGLFPDGAVVDESGTLWLAQWGAGRIAAFNDYGRCLRAIRVPARQCTCPAFGGPDRTTLFCTSAAARLSDNDSPANGMVIAAPDVATGQAEWRVIL